MGRCPLASARGSRAGGPAEEAIVTTPARDPSLACEIVLGKRLGPRSLRGLESFTATEIPDDGMRLVGLLPDQAALHGVLARIRDLGVPLVSVRMTEVTGGEPATLVGDVPIR
jgi:hypothetical protein